jgi:hypothetical protein
LRTKTDEGLFQWINSRILDIVVSFLSVENVVLISSSHHGAAMGLLINIKKAYFCPVSPDSSGVEIRLMKYTIGSISKFTSVTKAARIAAGIKRPEPVNIPTATLRHRVAAVLNPLTLAHNNACTRKANTCNDLGGTMLQTRVSFSWQHLVKNHHGCRTKGDEGVGSKPDVMTALLPFKANNAAQQ